MPDPKPSVSAILLSYNCEDFIAEAIQSVLAQDCEPMEVLVSDDASEDDTFAVLEREIQGYCGPHQVDLRRRSTTSGSKSAHLNLVFPETSGDILVSFDGDDVSEPRRVRRIVDAFQRDASVFAVYSTYGLIDEFGRRQGRGKVLHPPTGANTRVWFARVDAYAAGTTLAVRRKVIEAFGALDPQIYEDIVLPFRASLLGEVHYIGEELVRARRRPGSLTANHDRFASVQSYRLRMHQGIEQARRHLGSRLADLAVADNLMPDRGAQWQELREIASTSLTRAESTAGLVSPSFWARLRALLQLIRSGAYREELVQNLCLTFIPTSYLRYKRSKLRVDRDRDGRGIA